jgi:hypothetical protein
MSFIRLYWSNKETPYNPIPLGILSHAENDDLKKSLLAHHGRDLLRRTPLHPLQLPPEACRS